MFPVEPYRWIAVIDGPGGGVFSTEAPVAAGVWREVKASIQAVLRLSDPKFELVDDLGEPWSPAAAPAQMQRLGVRFDSSSWRPDKLPWRQRLFSRRAAWFGDCPSVAMIGASTYLLMESAASVATRSSTKSLARQERPVGRCPQCRRASSRAGPEFVQISEAIAARSGTLSALVAPRRHCAGQPFPKAPPVCPGGRSSRGNVSRLVLDASRSGFCSDAACREQNCTADRLRVWLWSRSWTC